MSGRLPDCAAGGNRRSGRWRCYPCWNGKPQGWGNLIALSVVMVEGIAQLGVVVQLVVIEPIQRVRCS